MGIGNGILKLIATGFDAVNDRWKTSKESSGAYLPAKTMGTAVDDTYTTVLDWVEVIHFPNWAVYINNAGGGSGHDLEKVRIYTSDNGVDPVNMEGARSTFELEADTLTAAGDAGIAFIGVGSSARYVMAQAKCASGEDTTVDCGPTSNAA